VRTKSISKGDIMKKNTELKNHMMWIGVDSYGKDVRVPAKVFQEELTKVLKELEGMDTVGLINTPTGEVCMRLMYIYA
jgi:hypothetical protein